MVAAAEDDLELAPITVLIYLVAVEALSVASLHPRAVPQER
jgi:hypothetical protein